MFKGSNKTRVIANVIVGPADVDPDTPSHIRGVFEGNHPHLMERSKAIEEHGLYAEGSARRSTGIRASHHEVIDPRMPRLSPA